MTDNEIAKLDDVLRLLSAHDDIDEVSEAIDLIEELINEADRLKNLN